MSIRVEWRARRSTLLLCRRWLLLSLSLARCSLRVVGLRVVGVDATVDEASREREAELCTELAELTRAERTELCVEAAELI